jgi:hypothetical protein
LRDRDQRLAMQAVLEGKKDLEAATQHVRLEAGFACECN